MNISVFGLGYVGCVSIGCLSQNGHRCIGVDLNEVKVDFLNSGRASIIEKDIDIIISEQHQNGRISATSDFLFAVNNSEVSIICVGTPSTNNGHLNLNAVFRVAEEIGQALKQKDSHHVVVIRSTVLPGTNDKVRHIIENVSGKNHEKHFVVVSNPEFLREGTAVHDFFNPPYTLIGTTSQRAAKLLKLMYQGIEAPFIVTNIKIAEMIKYVNNAFHANKIIFANEIGNICKKMKIDSHELMDIFLYGYQIEYFIILP